MSSSATGVGMTICFLGAILLILTQKSSQKFGDVLGILYFVCQPFSEHIGIMGSVFERNGYHYIKTVNIGMVAV